MPTLIDTAAQSQGASWLAVADAGDSRASWDAAGATFQGAVSPERWAEQLAAARGPLGALTSRALAVEQALNGIPGAPAGEYVVQQYHSVYSGVKAVVETLTLQRAADGAWRVVGYFIR